MKTIFSILGALIIFGCMDGAAFAEDSSAMQLAQSAWNVRVEVLMVALPQAKALKLLPNLRAPETIEAAVVEIFSAIEHKEALLIGYPVVFTKSGMSSNSDTVLEERYPTAFDLSSVKPTSSGSGSAINSAVPSGIAYPCAFETRNCGTMLEASPVVLPGGDWIDLSLVPQHVALKGYEKVVPYKTSAGKDFTIESPEFLVSKLTGRTLIRNGQRMLFGVHKMINPKDHIELFILQAVAIPIR